MRVRRLLATAVVAVGLGAALGAAPSLAAAADGPPTPLVPPGISGPTVNATPTPGPTYVITPGSTGHTLGAPQTGPISTAPATPTRSASVPGSPTTGPTAPPSATGDATQLPSTQPTDDAGSTGPQIPDTRGSSRTGGDLWWMIGAAILVVVGVLGTLGGVKKQRLRRSRR
ncbi:MAG: hypothetical protein JWP74_666 [Marmoricola sp.]|nr:hypothetical protein [Marmoricola sp.]